MILRQTPRQSKGFWFSALLVAERQAGLDAIHIGLIDHCGFRHVAFLVGVFTRQQVPPGSVVANNLTGPGDLKTFGHGFARFAACDCFWHWKRGKNYQAWDAKQ